MTSPSPLSGAPMTLIASGNSSCSLCERWRRKWPPSNHSNVTVPGTTASTCGWVASVTQVPISTSKPSRAGARSVMSIGPSHRAELIARSARRSGRDPEGDRAAVALAAVAAPGQLQRRARAPGLRVDHVLGMARVGLAVRLVRRVAVDGGGRLLVEEELAGVDDAAPRGHLEVDVRRAPAIPAGIDGQEAHATVGPGLLMAAQVAI